MIVHTIAAIALGLALYLALGMVLALLIARCIPPSEDEPDCGGYELGETLHGE